VTAPFAANEIDHARDVFGLQMSHRTIPRASVAGRGFPPGGMVPPVPDPPGGPTGQTPKTASILPFSVCALNGLTM
jgi:hypothetical protein